MVNKPDGETELLAAIEAMPEEDRAIAEKLHAVVRANAPELMCRTWYGMPAYTDGNKIICWFRSRKKFGERYMTLGFNDIAKLDEGTLWPISFAVTALSEASKAKLAELIRKAVG